MAVAMWPLRRPLKRTKTLAWKVRVCKRGWPMDIGALDKEEDSDWAGQGV